MGLIVVASAKGSPGVTTTSLAVGALWERPAIVAECDPSGGDIAWRIPAPDGQVLDSHTGLLSLVAAGRKSLHPGLVRQHTQTIVGGLEVLVGVGAPEQAGGLTQQWAQFGPLFAAVPGYDVIADLGRIGSVTPQNNLLGSASAIVLVVNVAPSSSVHLRERLGFVNTSVGGPMGAPIHVVVVAPPKRTQAVREIRDALARTEIPLAGIHHVAHDPRGANVFQGQIKGNPDRTALVRSVLPIAHDLSETTAGFFLVPDHETMVSR